MSIRKRLNDAIRPVLEMLERRDLFAVPHADPGGPYAVNEGSTQIITGVASTGGSLTYQWDLNYDGVTFHPLLSGSSFSFKPSDGNTTRHMALKVTNVDGNEITPFDVTVNNVAPTINVSGSGTGTEGNAYAVTWTASDPGVDTISSWRVNWGDGGAVQVLAANATGANHTFATAGSYAVVVSAVDEDGTTAAPNHNVTITHVLPIVTATGNATVNEGANYTFHFSATDAGGTAVALWAVDWGDGSSDVFDGSATSATHAFDDNGSYTLTATAVSEDGDSGDDTLSLTVNNVAPTPTITGTPVGTVAEGSTVSLSATRTDPGVSDTVTYAWAVTKNGSAFDSGTGATFEFVPNDNGAYVATLTATDNDGGHSSVHTSTITATNVNPVATISGTPGSNIDEGTAVTLAGSATDAGSADTQSYSWTVTKNGSAFTTGTGASFVFTPTDEGTYVATLTATDDDAGHGADTATIAVDNVAPTGAAIGGAPANSNEGTAITLTGSATDVGAADTVTYGWVVTKDGAPYTTGSGASFHFTPNDNAAYAVTLTASDGDGGTDTDIATITGDNVAPGNVTITGAPTTSAEGTPITLGGSATDAGSADTITYGWVVTKDGGAFDTGSGSSYSFTPDDNGAYVATLTATDDDGGDTSTASTITVTNVAPTPTISGTPVGTVAEGSTVSLSATRTDPGASDTVTYAWTVTKNGSAFDSGTGATFEFVPNDNGAYVATLTATDNDGGHASVSTSTITATNVNPVATISGTPGSNVDEGTAVTLTGSSTDAGSNDVVTYAWAVLKNGHAYTSGTGASFSFTPDDNGTYAVTLTATDDDGGTDTDTATVTADNVAPTGAAISGASAHVNEGTAVTLSATASDVGTADELTYTWAVTKGGGAYVTGSGSSFTFTPNDNGSYVVTLTATDDDGGTDTDTATITGDNVAPSSVTVTGAPSTSPEGTQISLSGSASDAGSADTLTYDWDVTKGGSAFSTGTGSTFNFTPDDNASYVVTFTATDDDGDHTSTTRTIGVTNVNPAPTITGTPGSVVEGATITLAASATDAGSLDTFSYGWAVTKNGSAFTTGSASSFAFTPTDNGAYVATLTATDNDGGHAAVSSSTITVTNANPTVAIGGAPGSSVNEGSGVTLTATPTDAGADDTHTYAWVVTKNGSAYTSGTGATYSFTPNDNGSYVATVTATDDDGGTGTDAVTITADNVNPNGAAISGSPANSNEGTPVTLGASASDVGSADTISYAWVVTKDGGAYTTGTGSSFHFTPNDNGSYVITMTASDDDGGTNADATTIAVANVAPSSVSISGAPTSIAEGTAFTMTGSASDVGSADTLTYAWSVTKNGSAYTTGAGSSFTVTPNDNGAYVVTLTATDDDAGATSTNQTITVTNVNPVPTITGTVGSVTEGTPITLAASSTDVGTADTVTYAWSVAKGGSVYATGSGSSFSFTPNDNGAYIATVVATDDDGGHASTSTGTIFVTNANPDVTLSGAPIGHVNEGTAVTLSAGATDVGTADTQTFTWNVTKDGSAYTTGSGASFNFTPNDNGSYVVTVTATDDDGGTDTDTATVTVDNVDPIASIGGAPGSSNEGTAITLTGSAIDPGTADIISYGWTVLKNGSAYTTGTGSSYSFTPNDNGTYSVTLTTTDDDGASDTDTTSITVNNVNPTNTAISGAPSSSVEGTTISLTSSADDAGSADTLTYAWSVTKNGSSFTTSNGSSFHFTPDDNGNYVVSVTTSDDDGGTGTDSKTISVTNANPVPTITGTPSGTIVEGATISLSASSTDAGTLDTVTYAWTVTKDGSAFTSGTGASISFSPNDNGTYIAVVTATDNDGGHATASTGDITVVNADPVATIGNAPGAHVNEGSAVNLTASATDAGTADSQTFTWSVLKDSHAFSTGSGSNFSFTPTDNGSYVVTLTATDDDGGIDTDTATVTVDNVNPNSTAIGGAPVSSPEGDSISLTGSASDVGADDIISYGWTVTKNGNPYTTGAGSSFSFTPTDNGTYAVTLTATDDDGGASTNTASISVTNVNPVASITDAPSTSPEGSLISVSSNVSDVGVLDTFSYAWSVTKGGNAFGSAGTSASYNFTPTDNGTYVITLTVTDKDGGHTTDTKTVAVQNVAPTGTIGAPSGSIDEGTALHFTSTISDAGSLDTVASYLWSVTKNGSEFVLPGGTSVSGSTFDFTPTDNGSYVVNLTVADNDGGISTGITTGLITVDNAAPVVGISGEPIESIAEGDGVFLTGSATDAGALDTLTYLWSVKRNDSTYTLADGVSTNGGTLSFHPSNQGSYVVTLKVTDKDGLFTTATSSEITVTNAAPVATVTGAPSGSPNEGSPITVGVTATDAGIEDSITYLWSVTRNGGDVTLPGGTNLTGTGFTFTPTNQGNYVITVRATDNDGSFVDASSNTIVVQNVAPVGALTGDVSGAEGSEVSLTASGTDVGVDDELSFAWSVTRGLTTITSGTGEDITFTPDDNGTYVVTVTTSDGDGGSDVDTQNVVVSNVAPTGVITGTLTGQTEGTEVTLTASATDPSDADTEAGLVLSWSVTKNGANFDSGTGADISFTPNDNGTYVVTLTTTDQDSATHHTTATISVGNVNPVASITGIPDTATEGSEISLGSEASDAGDLDTLTYAWSVRKAGQLVNLGDTTTNDSEFSFTPADNGTYTIRLVVTDKDGGAVTTNEEISVDNANPTANVDGPAEILRGTVAHFTGDFDDAGVNDTQTIIWSFGDGATQTFAGTSASATAVNHTYTTAGDYTVTYTVTDNNGGATTSEFDITVSAAMVDTDPRNTDQTALFINGTNSADQIEMRSGDGGTVEVLINGESQGLFTFDGKIYVNAYGGDDNISMDADVTASAVIDGGTGNDNIAGGAGNDTIIAGIGDDQVRGGAGNDSITGGSGADRLIGGDGNDFIDGGTENDIIYGQAGNDLVNGGSGKDRIYGGDGDDNLNGGDNEDTITGEAGKDRISGDNGNDNLDGGAGADQILGGAGNDQLLGGTGADKLYGQAGNDTMNGGADADKLDGGDGKDTGLKDVLDGYVNTESIVKSLTKPSGAKKK